MLKLGRRRGETIILYLPPNAAGDVEEVRLTIDSVQGQHVRVAVDAPDNVRILRAELAETIDGVVKDVRFSKERAKWEGKS